MEKCGTTYGPLKFVIKTMLLQQRCLECQKLFRGGLVCVVVEHTDGKHLLGASEAITCSACGADMTHVSAAFFSCPAEAVVHVTGIIDRLRRSDSTLLVRLAGYEAGKPMHMTLQ